MWWNVVRTSKLWVDKLKGSQFENHRVCYALLHVRYACAFEFIRAISPASPHQSILPFTHSPQCSIHNYIPFYRSFVSVFLRHHCNLRVFYHTVPYRRVEFHTAQFRLWWNLLSQTIRFYPYFIEVTLYTKLYNAHRTK